MSDLQMISHHQLIT